MWIRNECGVFGDGNLCVLSRDLPMHKIRLPKHPSIPSVERPNFSSHFPFGESNENHWAVYRFTVIIDHGFCCFLSKRRVPKPLCVAPPEAQRVEMRLLQGGSLNNYFALIKKDNGPF